MNKKTVSILSGAAGIILSGAIYKLTDDFPPFAPHAKQYVIFLLGVMAVLCAALVVTSLLGHEEGKPQWVKSPRHFTVTIVLIVLNVMAMKYVGFYISSAVFMLLLGFLLGLRRPLLLIVSTIALLALIYGVFVKFLGVPVPLGVFEDFTFTDIAGSIAKAKEAWQYL